MKWLDSSNFNDVFYLVLGAFVGWITENMHAAYICQKAKRECTLYVFFTVRPNRLDQKIIKEEVLSVIEDAIYHYGISEFYYKEFVVDSMATFREENGLWINECATLFQKYEFQPYDLED